MRNYSDITVVGNIIGLGENEKPPIMRAFCIEMFSVVLRTTQEDNDLRSEKDRALGLMPILTILTPQTIR